MDSLDVVSLTRTLIDIDSTTGRETEVGAWLADYLRGAGYDVSEQPVDDSRFNLIATLDAPQVVLSTHLDCVPPFASSREHQGVIYGRGACDAKGCLAAQIEATRQLRHMGERRVGLLFVVGEERGSDGARAANSIAPRSRYFVNGEPTDNRLALATQGVWRVRLKASGRAAHSALPHLGDSAIEKLVNAIQSLRTTTLPEDPELGQTTYSVGLISGGIAPNVIPAEAEAEVTFRTVGLAEPVRSALKDFNGLVQVEEVLEIPPARMMILPGFDTLICPFTTDVPLLSSWGRPLLLGPGSAEVAHTDREHVRIDDLHRAIDQYIRIATTLLADNGDRPRSPSY